MKRFGMTQQPACSPNDIETLKRNAVDKLECAVSDGFLAFLSVVNGLDWNGLVVYASQPSLIVGFNDRFIEGFVEGNLTYRDFEPLKGHLIFADDGDALFTYQVSTSKYQVLTSVGLSCSTPLMNCFAMLCKATRSPASTTSTGSIAVLLKLGVDGQPWPLSVIL